MFQKLAILPAPRTRARLAPSFPTDHEFGKLSARELECARLVAKGFSNKEVGLLLEISPWTVATHLKVTFLKLGIRRRAELAYLMRRQI